MPSTGPGTRPAIVRRVLRAEVEPCVSMRAKPRGAFRPPSLSCSVTARLPRAVEHVAAAGDGRDRASNVAPVVAAGIAVVELVGVVRQRSAREECIDELLEC